MGLSSGGHVGVIVGAQPTVVEHRRFQPPHLLLQMLQGDGGSPALGGEGEVLSHPLHRQGGAGGPVALHCLLQSSAQGARRHHGRHQHPAPWGEGGELGRYVQGPPLGLTVAV